MTSRDPKEANYAMESKSLNRGLGAAKAAKQDEFYTQYVDIQKEVEAYLEFDPDTFRGKVVFCNCDDPFESNFFESCYDAAGCRIAKREGGVLALYVWDGMEILAAANADGTICESYSCGPGIAGDVGSLIAAVFHEKSYYRLWLLAPNGYPLKYE